MTAIPLTNDDANTLRTATIDGARWFDQLQLWQPGQEGQLTTGEHETAVILLSGTFDLLAGGSNWPARGARKTPFQGRPMAVFLPPKTRFRVGNDEQDGEILMISARQPEAEPEPEGKEALSRKPLLPLAGSNKSFDPKTGEWMPAEAFPTSAESLPPRRFEKLKAGDLPVERVFGEGYKAATISLDETVVPAGAALALKDIPNHPSCDEVLVFVRPEGAARIERGDASESVDADTPLLLAPSELAHTVVHSEGAATYVVIAYGGKQK